MPESSKAGKWVANVVSFYKKQSFPKKELRIIGGSSNLLLAASRNNVHLMSGLLYILHFEAVSCILKGTWRELLEKNQGGLAVTNKTN